MDITFIVFWSLVCWRVTSLLVSDTITGGLRARVGVYYDEHSVCRGKNIVARALCCHRCTSFWVALALTLLFVHKYDAEAMGLIVFMMSAGSIIIDRIVNGWNYG